MYNSLKTIRWLLSFLWTNNNKIRFFIIISTCFILVSVVADLSLPLLFKKIIDLFPNSENSLYTVHVMLIMYGALWISSQVANQLRSIIMYRVLERGIRLLNIHIFKHLHQLAMKFHIDNRLGAMTSAFERAQTGFEIIVLGLCTLIAPVILELIFVLIFFMYNYGIIYAILLCISILSYILFSNYAIKKEIKAQELYNEHRSQSEALLVDSFLNIETVKYFGNQKYELNQYNNQLKQQEEASVRFFRSSSIVSLGQSFVIGICMTIILILAGHAVLAKQRSAGDFLVINGYILQFLIPLQHIGYTWRQIKKGLQDIQAVYVLVTTKPDIKDADHAIDFHDEHIAITFDNVSFSYNNQRKILNEISLKIPFGKTVAIVGATGAGKSTIMRLLLRLYDVTDGRILLNNYDVRSIKHESLIKLFGIVSQDINLFNNTIYFNIAYGNPNATQQDIEQAIKFAKLDHFIEQLPDGYNTRVGERGLKLSGGEKQRIAIARVFLKQPKIFIFDEATSALDVKTEREIQSSLKKLSLGATTIIIAHRLSTITHADEIIVLDQGIIKEHGMHEELLKFNGLYVELWNKQKGKHLQQ